MGQVVRMFMASHTAHTYIILVQAHDWNRRIPLFASLVCFQVSIIIGSQLGCFQSFGLGGKTFDRVAEQLIESLWYGGE